MSQMTCLSLVCLWVFQCLAVASVAVVMGFTITGITVRVMRMVCAPTASRAVWVSDTIAVEWGCHGLEGARVTSPAATTAWLPVAANTTVASRLEYHSLPLLLLSSFLVVWTLPQPGEGSRVMRANVIAAFLFHHKGSGGWDAGVTGPVSTAATTFTRVVGSAKTWLRNWWYSHCSCYSPSSTSPMCFNLSSFRCIDVWISEAF